MRLVELSVARHLVSAALDRDRPLIAHLVVTRRCNLSCGYCTEYDSVSPPVPTEALRERIDHLARLRTVFVTFTGGEPLLHPELPALVAHARARGLIPVMNTNGFLLSRARIEALGDAGLYAMQISVDGVAPNDVTKKTLKPLLPKLRLLAKHAVFHVRVNTVLGAAPPEEALEVARTVLALGFDAKVSLVREPGGELRPVDTRTREVYRQIRALGRRSSALLSEDFQLPLVEQGRIEWKCRAGARFFHVCEQGLVHLCAPRHGDGARPLADYDVADVRRAFDERKRCTATCPVAYAHQASRIDRLRAQPNAEPARVHLRVVA